MDANVSDKERRTYIIRQARATNGSYAWADNLRDAGKKRLQLQRITGEPWVVYSNTITNNPQTPLT
jgi:hypothetical protein